MAALRSTLGWLRPHRFGSARAALAARRLTVEALEARWVFSTSQFTFVNNMTTDSQGDLAYSDSQIYVAIVAQDYSTAGTNTPAPYYYFDSSGNPHLTAGQGSVPSFQLSSLTPTTTAHTYTIDLPQELPSTATYGINSARVYFSMNQPLNLPINGDAVGSVNPPVQDNHFYDYFEFSLNSPGLPAGNLGINTTNVDQFGVPINIQVDSQPVIGISAATRNSVMSQFQTFATGANSAYSVLTWPTSDPNYGDYRISSPAAVLNTAPTAQNALQIQTTLQVGIGATDTTVNVYSAGAFPDPSVAPFQIQIGQEVMTVTAATLIGNGTTNWTVTRGAGATSHSATSFVTMPAPAMSATQQTLTVVNTVGFPTTYPFNVLVDSEIITVTGVKSVNLDGTTTWNVTRGAGGTQATTHNELAAVYYNGATSLAINNVFNAAIDALFATYSTGSTLSIHSIADGNDRTYTGSVTTDANGAYILQFSSADDPNNIQYNVYYPFFTNNNYFWAGYTPLMTPAAAPSWAASANLGVLSPSEMVFGCNGVFADNSFRADSYTASQQKVLADIENQIVSALNRGVALRPGYSSTGSNSWQDASLYYANNPDGQPYNSYAQFLHQSTISLSGLNYGFAFDDQNGQASYIGVNSFSNVTATLTPWEAISSPDPTPTERSVRWFLASYFALRAESANAPSNVAPPVTTASPAPISASSRTDAALAALASDHDDPSGLDEIAGAAAQADSGAHDTTAGSTVAELLSSSRIFLSSRRRR